MDKFNFNEPKCIISHNLHFKFKKKYACKSSHFLDIIKQTDLNTVTRYIADYIDCIPSWKTVWIHFRTVLNCEPICNNVCS